jgi:hypothetical protein
MKTRPVIVPAKPTAIGATALKVRPVEDEDEDED